MLYDGIKLIDGTSIINLIVNSGETFPSNPDLGELFYKTGTTTGLHIYTGSSWEFIGTLNNLQNHINDETKHLTSAQNTWIDAITVSSTEVNRLSGVTSNVQTQLNAKVNKAGDTMTGYLTLHANPTNTMHAATKQYVDNKMSITRSLVTSTGQTVFSIPQYTIGSNNLWVFVNGIKAYLGDSYTETTTSVTFTYTVSAGTIVEFLVFGE